LSDPGLSLRARAAQPPLARGYAYGKDDAAQQVYHGMRLHARLC
jgi:hypothetical protein